LRFISHIWHIHFLIILYTSDSHLLNIIELCYHYRLNNLSLVGYTSHNSFVSLSCYHLNSKFWSVVVSHVTTITEMMTFTITCCMMSYWYFLSTPITSEQLGLTSITYNHNSPYTTRRTETFIISFFEFSCIYWVASNSISLHLVCILLKCHNISFGVLPLKVPFFPLATQ